MIEWIKNNWVNTLFHLAIQIIIVWLIIFFFKWSYRHQYVEYRNILFIVLPITANLILLCMYAFIKVKVESQQLLFGIIISCLSIPFSFIFAWFIYEYTGILQAARVIFLSSHCFPLLLYLSSYINSKYFKYMLILPFTFSALGMLGFLTILFHP